MSAWGRAPLLGFEAYRETEGLGRDAATNPQGTLLEYETLALRVDPPNVTIDNETFSDCTRLTIDSANRPGTLVEVVQCLTELSLSIRRARISSDGGWFLNELHICEPPSGRVTNERKLAAIRRMLSVGHEAPADAPPESRTVFQMVGPDARGILADMTQLLIHNGCDVRSAALWTFRGRVACVICATEAPGGRPVSDAAKLARLRQILMGTLATRAGDSALVEIEQVVSGAVHHERRLHQLMLADEHKAWQQLVRLQRHPSLPFPARVLNASERCPDVPAADLGGGGGDVAAAAAAATAAVAAVLKDVVDVDSRDQEATELGGRTLRLQQQEEGQQQLLGSSKPGTPAPPAAAAGAQPPPSPVGKPGLRVNVGGAELAGAGGNGFSKATAAAATLPAAGVGAAPGSGSASASQPSTPLSQPTTPRTPSALSRELSSGGAAAATPFALAGGRSLRLPPLHPPPPQPHQQATPPQSQQQQSQQQQQQQSQQPALTPLPSPAAGGRPPLAGGPYATAVAAAAAAAAELPAFMQHHDPLQAAAAPAVPGAFPGAAPPPAEPAAAAVFGRPQVTVKHNKDRQYWLVDIRCKDRNKLCFDTVCTLADMRLDTYHATIDSEGGIGSQLFYCRPRFGATEFDRSRAESLTAMLTSAVQRRFPAGLKVLVVDGPEPEQGARPGGQLAHLAAALRDWGLSVTRCKVRETAGPNAAAGPQIHTFYLAAGDGRMPSKDVVRQACEAAGGEELPDRQPWREEGGGGADGAGGQAEVGSIPSSWQNIRRGKFGFAFAPPSGRGIGGAARQRRLSGGAMAAAHGGRGVAAPWASDGVMAASFDSGHTMSF